MKNRLGYWPVVLSGDEGSLTNAIILYKSGIYQSLGIPKPTMENTIINFLLSLEKSILLAENKNDASATLLLRKQYVKCYSLIVEAFGDEKKVGTCLTNMRASSAPNFSNNGSHEQSE